MAEPGMEPEPEPERGREPVTAEAVLRELRLFELRCQGEEVPDKLVELCLSHGLGPVALANELLAFVTSKDLDLQLTPESLDAFEHEVLAKRGSRGRRGRDERRGLLHDIHSLQELLSEEQEDELLDAYSTPSKGSQKRSNSTPEAPRPKRAPSSRSPYGLFSPGSFSPSVTPSQKYSSRGGRGEVVASFGSEQGLAWSGRGGCSVRVFGQPEQSLSKPYKFMFQKALDVREVLAGRVEELGEVLRRHHGLDGFSSTALPAQEPVTVLGQISCDGNGKLNPKSVLLLGDREHSGGAPVPLDLSELPEYSLFPGQVLAVEGTNSTGRRMVVSRLYEGVPLPFHSPTEPMAEQRMVLVACGPFTPSDGVAFEPLSDLLELVSHERPDVCVLFGPFLDAKHEQVESCQLLGSFSDVFRLCLRSIVEGTRSAGCQLVLVPSLRDVFHDFVYPQPPFPFQDLPKEDRARVLLVSEPCTLDIDGVVFGLSSTDVLLHLGAEEISSSSGISDRFTRILRHVLTQRSFYPLYPPSEELNVDLEALAAFAALPVTPDVLVTPSELRFFVKVRETAEVWPRRFLWNCPERWNWDFPGHGIVPAALPPARSLRWIPQAVLRPAPLATMSTKVPIYLKRGSRKGKKEKLRDILSSDMISPPLGDFRHTIHIGSGGQGDTFGDISFLQGKFHLLPRAGAAPTAPEPFELARAATMAGGEVATAPSPLLKNAISLPALGGAQALTLPAAQAPPKPPRLHLEETATAVSPVRATNLHLEEMDTNLPLDDTATAVSPAGARATNGEAGPLASHAGSLLSLHVDLGPSILDEVLQVMDRHQAERGAPPQLLT